MKKINFFKLVSLLVVVVFVAACNDNYPESHSVDTLIALDKKDVTLHAGESVNLSAKINFQKDGKNVATTIEKKVNWESSNSDVATIDANGKVTAVKGGTAIITAECQGTVESCAISVKDIFVAGNRQDSINSAIEKSAVIWQRCDTGAVVKYSVPNAEFTSMVVNEQGIYYAGIENGTAKVWKDGVELYSLGEINKTIVASMCVENGIVYVVGHDTISKENIAARLWKNGKSVELELNNDTTFAYDVAVENGKVYVAGVKFREKISAYMYDAVIWANGVETLLEKPAGIYIETAQAKSICINNGAIYVGGSVDDDTNEKPYIWKDGVSCFDFADKGKGYSVKNIKFMNNVLYAFYGTTLWMGDVKSTDITTMQPAQGSGYADAVESLGSVFIVGQGYPRYKTEGNEYKIADNYDGKALTAQVWVNNALIDFLPNSMRVQENSSSNKPTYPRSNAIAIGVR